MNVSTFLSRSLFSSIPPNNKEEKGQKQSALEKGGRKILQLPGKNDLDELAESGQLLDLSVSLAHIPSDKSASQLADRLLENQKIKDLFPETQELTAILENLLGLQKELKDKGFNNLEEFLKVMEESDPGGESLEKGWVYVQRSCEMQREQKNMGMTVLKGAYAFGRFIFSYSSLMFSFASAILLLRDPRVQFLLKAARWSIYFV